MVTVFMMPVKLTTLGLLKTKVLWNKKYCIIISVHDVTNKTWSRSSNYIVDVVMWPDFGNCGLSMREVVITSVYSSDKKVKLIVRKFLRLVSTFSEMKNENEMKS